MTDTADTTADLQFDTVVADAPAATDAPLGVRCSLCEQQLADEYFQVNAAQVCGACRDVLLAQVEVPRSWMLFLRALGWGVGGAIVGAILYYAVIAITGFEIGFVALAIGYIVGHAIRRGTRGRGGRRFQIAAVALTYWSVGLAYTPVVIAQLSKEKSATAAASTTGPTTAASPSIQDASASPASEIRPAVAIAVALAFTLALPVLIVFGSLPSGLISAFIIGLGMRQAWQLTSVPTLNVSGPYRIGTAVENAAG